MNDPALYPCPQAHVICAGKIACELLLAPSDGIVFAVFQRTFYLKRFGSPISTSDAPSLCCIGQADLQPGPINVRTSLEKIPALAVGTHWRSHQRKITIGPVELQFAQPAIWLPPPCAQPSKPVHHSVEILTRLVTAANTLSIDDDSISNRDSRLTIDEIVKQQLTNTTKQLQQWLNKNSNNIMFPTELLGCGTGLTPAGDDILVGALAAMHTWQHPRLDQLIAHVAEGIRGTSDISAAHLQAACSGSGIEPLHRLISAISSGTIDQEELGREIVDATNTLCNYGHSSGYYAIRGVLLAARSYRTF